MAVFGAVMVVLISAMTGLMFTSTGDYNYDEIQDARDELHQFTGNTMINDSPWRLTAIYTPWVSTDGTKDHVDNGWLYGEKLKTSKSYSGDTEYVGKYADIKLDPNHKSSVPLAISEQTVEYEQKSEHHKWWAHNGWVRGAAEFFGVETHETETLSASIWSYTGYRYYFDPTLPFSAGTEDDGGPKKAPHDGALSIVWYNYNEQEGLSGGLEVFGEDVILASYSATDIVADYNTGSGYATSYDFNFDGVILTLSIRFDQDAISQGKPMISAWSDGDWSMAISSESAGNFFDISNSTSFTNTAGSLISTFKNILTFDVPNLNDPWAEWILWVLVALPLMVCLCCVTLRIINSFRVL